MEEKEEKEEKKEEKEGEKDIVNKKIAKVREKEKGRKHMSDTGSKSRRYVFFES